MSKKRSNPETTSLANSTTPRQSRLKKRLREINTKTEKDLAIIFASIEKAKAAFRSKKP